MLVAKFPVNLVAAFVLPAKRRLAYFSIMDYYLLLVLIVPFSLKCLKQRVFLDCKCNLY